MAEATLVLKIDSEGNLTVVKQASTEVEKLGKTGKEATSGLEAMKEVVHLAAGAFAAWKIAEKGIELTKLGAASLAANDRLIAFAGSAQMAEQYMAALNRGALYGVDRLTALTQSSAMVEQGLVTSTREMEIAGGMISRLGNAALGTEQKMQILSLMLANQSTMRLDTFGLSVEKVTARQRELEAQGVSTRDAFRTAVFEEAAVKLGTLGDQSGSAAVQIAQVEASVKTLTQSVGELMAAGVQSTGALDDVAGTINTLAERLRTGDVTMQQLAANMGSGLAVELGKSYAAWKNQTETVSEAATEISRYANLIPQVAEAQNAAVMTTEQLNAALKRQAETMAANSARFEGANWLASWEAGQETERIAEMQRNQVEMEELEKEHQRNLAGIVQSGAQDRISIVRDEYQERMDALNEEMQTALDALAQELADQEFNRRLEDLAQRHEERMEQIRRSAERSSEQIENERYQTVLDNLDAELQAVLDNLNEQQQARLEALRREHGMGGTSAEDQRAALEAEHLERMAGLYSESAREAEQRRYEEALAELDYQEEEAALLEEFEEENAAVQEEFEARRRAEEVAHEQELLRIKQQAIQEQLAAEEQRYRREVDLMNQQRAEQEAQEARRAEIEQFYAAQRAEMERAMALEIAALEKQALQERIAAENQAYQERLASLDAFTQTARQRATENPIVIPVQLAPPGSTGGAGGSTQDWYDYLRSMGVPGYQHGGIARGGLALVGERGPELVSLPGGSQVFDNPTSGKMAMGAGEQVIIHNHFGRDSIRSDQDVYQMAKEQEMAFRRRGMRTFSTT